MTMMEDVMEMKKAVKQAKKEEQGIALQLLGDMKKTNKRLFVLLMVAMIISLVEFVGFMYYISSFENVIETTETYETGIDSQDNGTINIGGDVNNG